MADIDPRSAPRSETEVFLVAQLATCISFLSFFYYLHQGDLLLYGDAVAHINIARRVFDSLTPGPLQLGTVWLPLPHVLMIPFILDHQMWQSGVGGSLVSMAAYVFAVTGVFRLVRDARTFADDKLDRGAAWLAAVIFAFNPNLIYVQTTALTEPLYAALFIWALVYFSDFARNTDSAPPSPARPALLKCGGCIFAASLTRYDGWFLAVALSLTVLVMWLRSVKKHQRTISPTRFLLLAAAGPLLWLAYNAIVYKNPLEFANGPYSAAAIERNSTATTHPGSQQPIEAFTFFLRAAELNVAQGNWGRLWVVAVLCGSGILLARRAWALLLLLIPLPFYTLSVAYSGVPIYVPGWWPFSIYNIRYGLALLPSFAVFAAISVAFIASRIRRGNLRVAVWAAGVALFAVSYAFVWHATPVCFREAFINSRGRLAIEKVMVDNLKKLPPNATILMALGEHAAAVQAAGIPLRRVIHETNHRTWMKPNDPDGIWERALRDPQAHASYVIGTQDDPIDRLVDKRQLTSLIVIQALGEHTVTLYSTVPASK